MKMERMKESLKWNEHDKLGYMRILCLNQSVSNQESKSSNALDLVPDLGEED